MTEAPSLKINLQICNPFWTPEQEEEEIPTIQEALDRCCNALPKSAIKVKVYYFDTHKVKTSRAFYVASKNQYVVTGTNFSSAIYLDSIDQVRQTMEIFLQNEVQKVDAAISGDESCGGHTCKGCECANKS